MSERLVNTLFSRPDNNPVQDHSEIAQPVVEQGELQPEAYHRIRAAEKGELKAKLTQILDRGIVNDRLKVDLPPDVHGEWVRNDPLEIARLKALGFEIDTKYAPSQARKLHDDGTDAPIVGDTVFMMCSREVKEIIDEIRFERHIERNRKTSQREDKDLKEVVYRTSGGDVPAVSESKVRDATYNDVAEALKAVESQIIPAS